MSFITKDDYRSVIQESLLDDITQVDDDKISDCECQAIEFVSGYLNNRYDVEAIFSKTGSERNPFIVRLVMDLVIYYLHKLVNNRNMPASRSDAYKEAKEWLEKVNAKRINPRELPVLADGSRDDILFGGNPRRQNHI